jgi:hypothetical protein
MIEKAFDDSERELSQVLSFLSDCYGSYHELRNWSPTRMGEWRYGGDRYIATDPRFFSRNLHVWWDGPKVVGIVVGDSGGDISLMVGPDHRLLEDRMLEWAENELGKDRERITVSALGHDAWRQAALRKRGYAARGPSGILWRFDTLLTATGSSWRMDSP